MKCMPRLIPRSEVDLGITQRDQFNTDEFSIQETLVREPHQNSLDGKSSTVVGPVKTRIRLIEPSATNAEYWSAILEPLRPHLEGSRIDLTNLNLAMPRILLIEDFGTTGLLGSVDEKDDLNFSDFWRRFGLSHKKGGAGGRWGLGKLVFTSASAIGTLFGLTIRDSDPSGERFLMGQAILNKHKIKEVDYAPHIFFAVPAEDGFQLPERDATNIEAFIEASGISRKNEPGLSIAVMCAREGLEPKKLLPHVITNYFFPILTNCLIVEIDDKIVDKENFESLATAYGGPTLADGHLIKFIRRVDALRQSSPMLSLAEGWVKDGPTATTSAEQLASLRREYAADGLVFVRAPLILQRKSGGLATTFVDAFIQKTPPHIKGQALFVRGSITIPGESRSFRGRNSFAALLASDTHIVEFLGDSENPAHTRWVGSADKLSINWKKAPAAAQVAAIKRLLNDLNELVTEVENRVDESALIEFFSIPKPTAAAEKKPSPKPPPPPPPIPPIPPTPRAFNVSPKAGGFVITGHAASAVPIPYQIKIVVAYGVRRGNAFKKHKPQDFDLRATKAIKTISTGCSWSVPEANVVLVDVSASNFKFEMSGFDTERDLELDVRR